MSDSAIIARPPAGTAVDTTQDGQAWTIYSDETTHGRSCGGCKACCTQVPVDLPSGHKPANVRCKHLCSKGCKIYARRPEPCVFWSCRWLFDPDTAGLRRPDHSGYVIDAMLDTVITDGRPSEVVQVWVDPARPNAHRDPALRAYLQMMADRYGMISFVRWNSSDGMGLIPPSLSAEGEWLELGGDLVTDAELRHELALIGAAPRALGQRP